jgi:glucose-1-phosphate thymidylyltransferase
MKGIILAGGMGTRLMPLTKVTNKHLLPVGMKPMVLHPLGKLVEAGIKDIMVITGPEHSGEFMKLLGSGSEYDCELTYRMQDGPGGIAQALGLCEAFVGQDRVCVLLGDNIFDFSLDSIVGSLESKGGECAMVVVKHVDDPERYGVVTFDDRGEITSIEEKPESPKSNYIATGIYFYPPGVFDIIKTLEPSGRGELEITDVNNAFLADGKLIAAKARGEWTDAGTPESYAAANEIAKG